MIQQICQRVSFFIATPDFCIVRHPRAQNAIPRSAFSPASPAPDKDSSGDTARPAKSPAQNSPAIRSRNPHPAHAPRQSPVDLMRSRSACTSPSSCDCSEDYPPPPPRTPDSRRTTEFPRPHSRNRSPPPTQTPVQKIRKWLAKKGAMRIDRMPCCRRDTRSAPAAAVLF